MFLLSYVFLQSKLIEPYVFNLLHYENEYRAILLYFNIDTIIIQNNSVILYKTFFFKFRSVTLSQTHE